jgi:hypothetical protein
MKLDTNYNAVEFIDMRLLDPIIKACSSMEWSNPAYQRNEKVLASGKLLEYPFYISKRGQTYTDQETRLLESSRQLLQWIKGLPRYRGYEWIRGEVATLMPGVSLEWHKDPQWFHDNCMKIHVPLITNENCINLWEDEQVHFEVGQLYEFNNRVMHSAVNNSTLPRTHLIFDLMHIDRIKVAKDQNIELWSFVDAPGSNGYGSR